MCICFASDSLAQATTLINNLKGYVLLDAFEIKNGKHFTADEVSAALKLGEVEALFVCHECQDELRFVNASLNRRAYFAHKSEAIVSAPCKFRIAEAKNTRASNKFDKSFSEADQKKMVRAINARALHYLFQYRKFFGAEQNLYLKAKGQSELITSGSGKEDFWHHHLNSMFNFHKDSFSNSQRMVNEYFFRYLTSKQKIRPKQDRHIFTEFHQVFSLAISAAYCLVKAASKHHNENRDIKRLSNTIKSFDFFSTAEADLRYCNQVFAVNIGDKKPKSYSDLACMLVSERFTKIVLDMDIRGFLMSPEDFIDSKNSDGKILGFVYVFTAPRHAVVMNPLNFGSRANIIKVGETRRFPEKRAEELSNGFLFEQYQVYDAVFTNARLTLEKMVLSELAQFTVAQKNEFFDYHPEKAMQLIRSQKRKAEDIGDPPNDKRNITNKKS